MAETASIARPYSRAVFDLAHETQAYDAWQLALDNLVVISEDDDFIKLSNDPKISSSQLTDLLLSLSASSLPAGGENLLKLLVSNDRLDAVADIRDQYQELVAKAQSAITAEVTTARALTEQQKTALSSALNERLGLQVSIEETVDETLLGGAVIKAGDLVIDGSAKGRIEKLSSALKR